MLGDPGRTLGSRSEPASGRGRGAGGSRCPRPRRDSRIWPGGGGAPRRGSAATSTPDRPTQAEAFLETEAGETIALAGIGLGAKGLGHAVQMQGGEFIESRLI